MTYTKRYEVLEAAANWMRVCEAAGVEAMCKVIGELTRISDCNLNAMPDDYEFPLALLEGKEVWVGSDVYDEFGRLVRAEEFNDLYLKADGRWYNLKSYSWNPPKPKTVIVELPMRLVEFRAGRIELNNDEHDTLLLAEDDACKKALEKL